MVKEQLEKVVIDLLDDARQEYEEYSADLWQNPVIRETRNVYHHLMYSRYEHMSLVSKMAFYIAKRLGADAETCVRAAVLHDIGVKGLDGHYYNTAVARDFAKNIGESQQVQDAIYTHMFDRLPRTREAWALVLADCSTTSIEALSVLKFNFKKFIGIMYSLFPHSVN